jgi:hypothetical protein
MPDIFSQSRLVTCLTYTGRRGSQHSRGQAVKEHQNRPRPRIQQQGVASQQPASHRPHQCKHTQGAKQSSKPTSMGQPRAPSQHWQAPQWARAHTRPATQPHQWTHEPVQCQGTNAGGSPPATDQSACEWHTKRAVRVVAAPARPVDTRSQSSRIALVIQAAVNATTAVAVKT